VDKSFEPHPSHRMTEWRSTVVTITETSRFGRIRQCENCGAEEAETVCGHAAHEELGEPCTEGQDERTKHADGCG
jgi:hypothetical protein